jgi:hypothetical protein
MLRRNGDAPKRIRFEVKPAKGGDGWDLTRNGEKVSRHNTKTPAVKRGAKQAGMTPSPEGLKRAATAP